MTIDGRRGIPWARALFALVILGVGGCGVVVARGGVVPWWWIALLAVASQVAIGAGVFLQGAGLFARPLLGARPERAAGRVALTFDDGPDAKITPEVLALLEARGHRATFFVVGERAEKEPALLADMVRRGHQLGNHSRVHSWATPFVPPARLTADLCATQQLLDAAGNRGRWFRPPVGLLSPRVVEAAQRAGLTLVSWTVTARDGVATDVQRAAARVLPHLRAGAIVTLHDGSFQPGRPPQVVQLLPRILDELDARGLRSVTLDELFGVSA